VVFSLRRGADLHTVHLMPLPLAVSCFSKIQIGFTFLVPAHPGSPGQTAVKRVCACVVIMCERDVICKTKKYLCMTHCNVIREGLNQGHGSRVQNISQSLDMQFCDTRVDRQTVINTLIAIFRTPAWIEVKHQQQFFDSKLPQSNLSIHYHAILRNCSV